MIKWNLLKNKKKRPFYNAKVTKKFMRSFAYFLSIDCVSLY